MSRKIKSYVQLTSIIFTILMLLETMAGVEVSRQIVFAIFTCSLAAALIKLCFFPGILFEYPLSKQAGYLLLVLLITIACNYMFGWKITIINIGSVSVSVLIVYLIIRLVNYQFVKEEARRMNERLSKTQEDKQKKREDHF